MSSSFEVERYLTLARERSARLGQPLLAVQSTRSTNDLGLEAARSGAAHGATFVADTQTEGRGRHGRSWFAAPGESLLFSCLLRPTLAASRAPLLPLAVGLAVREVVARHVPSDVRVEIKWPNDVLAGRKKICGVLIESVLRGGELAAAVVGVGLNLRTTEFPAELSGSATSLRALGGEAPQREPLLVDLLCELDRHVELVRESGLEKLLPELTRHDALKGRRVAVDGVTGRARGLDVNGRLIVVDEAGTERSLVSGHVSPFED
jgi:BirA family transcriptional regulator, biotin operon repressor / biotin---[acetyl-CoA-carboxylase] ligase